MKQLLKHPFLMTALVLAVAGVFSWNQTRLEIADRVRRIEAADAAGTDTVASQASLKTYVLSHTATKASYQLAGSYDRDVAAVAASTAAAKTAQAQAYAAAQAVCAGHTTSITQAKCNQDYLDQHLRPTPVPPATPVKSQYTVSIRGPWWTTDLTGALFLGAACALALGLIKMRPRRPRR